MSSNGARGNARMFLGGITKSEGSVDIAYQLHRAKKAPPLAAQLSFLKSIGYGHIEVGPDAYRNNPKVFRKAMGDAGIDSLSILIPDVSDRDDIDEFIEVADVLGAKIIVRPGLRPELRPTGQDGWKRLAQRLSNEAGKAEAAGLKFAWRNHDFEFAPLQDGGRPIDLIVDNSSPNVRLTLDCGWVFKAGGDIKAELRRFSSRIIAIQAKDTALQGGMAEDGWLAHGDGVIDWPELLPAILATRATLVVVGHDKPSDWQHVAKRSRESLCRLFNIRSPNPARRIGVTSFWG